MQPLGLTPGELDAYHAHLVGPHDFRVDVDLLTMEEQLAGSLTGRFIDGQVNLQRDSKIKRTATLQLHDPDGLLRPNSPFDAALFADRMLRARHTVVVPGLGPVTATPFVGPAVKLTPEGDSVSVECHDKTALGIEGCPPMTLQKGRNAVEAIATAMRECTGERRFRFPTGIKRRLDRSYNIGWKPASAPFPVCQQIAKQVLEMDLYYACDGPLTLRRLDADPVLDLDDSWLTAFLKADHDISSVRNHVRVTGDTKKHVAASATAERPHPMRPSAIGRHGVPRYLPLLIDDSSIKRDKRARARANGELAANLPMQVTASAPTVPFHHLDYADPIRIRSAGSSRVVPYVEGSQPLGTGGDASVGVQRRVSKPERR